MTDKHLLLVGASRGLGLVMAAEFLKPSAPFGIEECIPNVVDVLLGQRGKPGLRFLDREGRTVPC